MDHGHRALNPPLQGKCFLNLGLIPLKVLLSFKIITAAGKFINFRIQIQPRESLGYYLRAFTSTFFGVFFLALLEHRVFAMFQEGQNTPQKVDVKAWK